MQPQKNRSLFPAVLLAITLATRLLPGARTIDDSYITFRYARNLLSGEGFVYNPGERVLGTTTPLYTLLMTGLGALSGGPQAPFPQIAIVVNALADAATALLLYKLGKRLGFACAGAGTAVVWALAPFSVTFAIGGLETSLYVLLLTATIYAYTQEKWAQTAFFAALSLLTRPDALILLALVGADAIWCAVRGDRGRRTIDREQRTTDNAPRSAVRRHRSTIRGLLPAIVFILPTAAWAAFATLYFGSPLPHSILAKSLAYRLPTTAGFIRLLQHYATPFLGHLTFGVPWIGVGLILYPFLFLIGGRDALRREPRLLPWALYPWLYFAVFALANPLIFRWYLTPPLPAYFFFIFAGIETLTQTASDAPQWRRILLPGLILLPVLLTLRGWELHPEHGPDRPAPRMAWFQLELLYQQVADFLQPHLGEDPAQISLAAGDVGVLGYQTGARILDTVGLNSPQALAYYPLDERYYVINYAVPPALILDQQPDFIVLLEVYGRAGLFKDPRFAKQYTLLRKIPTDIYGSDGMLIFTKKQAP